MALKLGSNVDLNKVVKSLGQKYKLVPHLDMAIGQGDWPWEFKYEPKLVDDAWHPSSDCTPSLRELYLKAKGLSEEQAVPTSLRKTFMVGHFWHQYLQWIVQHHLSFAKADHIERRGYRWWGTVLDACHPTVPLDITPLPYHWATGSGDIAPCSIPGHGDFVVDFKTQHARTFHQNGLPDWAADKYEAQINIYMDFFNLERGLIVCTEKDSPHDMKEYEYHRNQELIDRIYAKWQLVSHCLDEGIEPPVDEPFPLPFTGPVS